MTDEELIELLAAFMPESLGGWAAAVMAASAVLSLVLPQPTENAHPLLKTGHRLICILGMGAFKIRAAGKLGAVLKGRRRP